MRNHALKVMALQPLWTHKNTKEMEARGELIRNDISQWLMSHQDELAKSLGMAGADFFVQGKDGVGRKTEIPWVRFCSKAYSPRATEGWYCVYLFDATGDELYLCLSHGSTRFIDGSFKARSNSELEKLVTWAQNVLRGRIEDDSRITKRISLHGRTGLGQSYERSTAIAIRYTREDLPDENQLLEDAKAFARLLGLIYDQQDTGQAPEAIPPEIASAMDALEAVTKPQRKSSRAGQGFGLTAAERRVVELRAMELANEYLVSKDYVVQDVSSTHSYDLLAIDKAGTEYIVEVKGTTSGLSEVLLTSNEVKQAEGWYPHNFLIVVHGIVLSRSTVSPIASGGELRVIHPWKIEHEDLTPLSYRYKVPVTA